VLIHPPPGPGLRSWLERAGLRVSPEGLVAGVGAALTESETIEALSLLAADAAEPLRPPTRVQRRRGETVDWWHFCLDDAPWSVILRS
jgi:hypothetical protein